MFSNYCNGRANYDFSFHRKCRAGFGAFATNKAVEEETGMQTHGYRKKVEEQKIKSKDNKINKELSTMVKTNIKINK